LHASAADFKGEQILGIASALGLYILVSIFSSGAESDARWKILVLAIGSAFVQGIVLQIIPGIAGLAAAIVLSLALIAAGLMFWCGIERKATLKIVGAYFGLCIALFIASVFIHRATA
jgi:hypothetical protein